MIPYLCPELPQPQKEALRYAGQDAADLCQRGVAQLDRVQDARHRRGLRAGLLLLVVLAQSGRRYRRLSKARARRTSRCWSAWCARRASPGCRSATRTGPGSTTSSTPRSRLSSAISATSWPHPRSAAASIRRATSRRSPSIAGRTATPTNTIRCSIRNGREAQQPHVIGRARFGRIAIANSDSGAAAYTDSAIDQAYRAVQELERNRPHL